MERASRLTLSRVHELPLARQGERNVTREADVRAGALKCPMGCPSPKRSIALKRPISRSCKSLEKLTPRTSRPLGKITGMDREVTPYIDVLVVGVHDGRFAIDSAARSISSQCPGLRPDSPLEDTHDIPSFDAIVLRDLGPRSSSLQRPCR